MEMLSIGTINIWPETSLFRPLFTRSVRCDVVTSLVLSLPGCRYEQQQFWAKMASISLRTISDQDEKPDSESVHG
jgi:hypothetical protein